jgi:hypothetical protein
VNFDPFFIWLESTALSQWVVGSPSLFAFPGILTLHAIGMGFAVGICLALDLRILGVAPGVQIAEMRRYVPIVWFAFWLNAFSGLLLLIGYPTKALTNPVFYLKLLLIGVGLVLFKRIGRHVFDPSLPAVDTAPFAVRRLAVVSMVCWIGAITAGRFLAYTYTRLTAIP